MFHKSITSSNRHLLFGAALLFTNLLVFPSQSVATNAQNISCNNKHTGEKKNIYVEYLNAKTKVCHTMYNAGGSQTKQIAWAQSNPSLCTEVASNLTDKLSRAGWDCGGTMYVTRKTHLKITKNPVKAVEKTVKSVQPAQPINEDKEDYELLKTIKK
jgi:hypothetical protein